MSLPQLIRCKTKNNCFIMLWLVLLSQIQKFHWRRNNGLKLSLHAKGLSRYAISHFNTFRPRIHTLFPSKLDIWLQKNLKSMSCTREWSKSPWFSTTGKGKKMLCFCHWPLTCWLPYDYWWCSWQNGKKCSCFWRRWIKRGKKQTERKKLPPQGINPSSFCLR